VLDTDDKIAAYRAEIDASPAALPASVGASTQTSQVAKAWEEMSTADKHRLRNDNPEAYKALKEDHDRRKGAKR
jgi:hypothetical protein